MTTVAPPPPSRPAPPPPRSAPASAVPTRPAVQGAALTLAVPKFEPPRVILNAVEGFGKTSFLAHAPGAAILMAAGETGYSTLLGSGRVPAIPAARIDSWDVLLATIDSLIADPGQTKALGLDASGGFERLCHEHVCNQEFKGDWGDRGFASYQKGYDLSVTHWLGLLARLDRLRDQHGTTIVLLSHCKVTTFKNPDGPDFDRYCSDLHQKTWAPTYKWADCVLFGNYVSVVDGGKTGEKAKKGKGIGGTQRVVYTHRRDAYDAKERYGMPEAIDIPNDPAATWPTIWQYIQPRA